MIKTYHARTRKHQTSYHNGLMGEKMYQNDPDVQIYPGQDMYEDAKQLAMDITDLFLNHPYEDRQKQWASPSFTDGDPVTGKKYMIRGKTFRRHPEEAERERASHQYRTMLHDDTYTCGKTWTVQEMVIYLLQPCKAYEYEQDAPFHVGGLKRINRLVKHLKKWRPNDFGHLNEIQIVDEMEETLL